MTEFLVWLVIVGLVVLLIWFVTNVRFSNKGAGSAYLTALHDFSPKDKQQAYEIIIEQKAGKRLEEDTNAAPPKGGVGGGAGDTDSPGERDQP